MANQAEGRVFIRDVSFAGSKITIDFGNATGGSSQVEIVDFMDDANPIEFQDCEVSSVGVNCNGAMIRYAKPNVIMASVTVIPYSASDAALHEKWVKYRVQGKYDPTWEQSITLTVDLGEKGTGGSGVGTGKRTIQYTNGTFVSGPAGYTSNGEGKMQGRTYTFAFATV